jgi:hypothetical protein
MTDRPLDGVYAVSVSNLVADDPVRWLFISEDDADMFCAAINGDSEFPEATVTYEPIAYSLADPDLAACYPDETREANRIARLEA